MASLLAGLADQSVPLDEIFDQRRRAGLQASAGQRANTFRFRSPTQMERRLEPVELAEDAVSCEPFSVDFRPNSLFIRENTGNFARKSDLCPGPWRE